MNGRPWGLPKSWQWVHLKDVSTHARKVINPSGTPEQRYNYLELERVLPGQWEDPGENWVLGRAIRSSCVEFRPKQVLYSKLRPYLNKVVVTTTSGIASGEFIPIAAKDAALEPSYLGWYLRCPQFVTYATSHTTGSRQPRVAKNALWSASVPLPSIPEQRRIVAKIEALFDRIREAKRLRTGAQRDTEVLIEATVAEVFREGKVDGWPIKTIGDLIVGKPQYGISRKASDEPIGVPILRMGNIFNGEISFDDLKYVELSVDEERKYKLNEGDILFNRTNSAELVGKSAVYPGGRRAVFASYLIRAVPDFKKIVPQFLVAYMNSPFGREYFQAQLTRAIGQVNINAKKLQGMTAPVPSLEEQQRVVAYLDGVAETARGLKKRHGETDAELKRLEQSVLDRAFRGEL